MNKIINSKYENQNDSDNNESNIVTTGNENMENDIDSYDINESSSINGFKCKYCSKVFKYKQGMYRHIKYTCKNNEEESFTELTRLMNIKFNTDDINSSLSNQREKLKRDRAIERG